MQQPARAARTCKTVFQTPRGDEPCTNDAARGSNFCLGCNARARLEREMAGSPAVRAQVTPLQPARVAGRICSECGTRYASMFCPLSRDGQGPHRWVTVQPTTAEEQAFLLRVGEHMEQGAQER